MRAILTLLNLLVASMASAETYRELYTKPAATNASNINGGSSETRLFQRTNGNWNSSTRVFTATGDTIDSSWVGQLACVVVDGATTGGYFAEVSAIDNSAKTITLHATRTLGTAPGTSATARTITIGGAWTGPSGGTTFPFSINTWSSVTNANSDRVRFNLCGSFTTNVTPSIFSPTGIVVQGYTTAAGDGGFAEMDYNGAADIYTWRIGSGGGVVEVRDVWFHNNSTAAAPTSAFGLVVSDSSGVGFCIVSRCRFSDCASGGLLASGGTSVSTLVVKDCEFFDCFNNGSSTGACLKVQSDIHATVERSIFHDNGSGVVTCIDVNTGHCAVRECVFESNTVGISDTVAVSPRNCVFYNNTTALSITPGSSRFGVHAYGCVFENNATAVSRGNTTADKQPIFDNCVFYNNTTKYDSNATGRVFEVNCTDASRSCMVDPANGDFRLRESSLRGSINASLLQSSSYYTKFTTVRRSPGIEPSNPFYR